MISSLALAVIPALAFVATARVLLTPVSGQSPFGAARCASTSLGTNYPGDVVEPYVTSARAGATAPESVVALYQQGRWSTGGASGMIAAQSSDGGAAWRTVALPFSRCATDGTSFDRASNGWLSAGLDGTVYASSLTFTPYARPGEIAMSPGLAVAVSKDGGRTWGAPVLVVSDSADKDAVTADPIQPDTAYLAWRGVAGGEGGLVFSKTIDGGRDWSTPMLVSPINGLQDSLGGQILVDPHTRALYEIHETTYGPFRPGTALASGAASWTVISLSTDGGATWKTRKVAKQRSMGKREVGRSMVEPPIRGSAGMPSSTIDTTTGQLYAVWEDARFTNGKRFQIVLSTSRDGGKRWSVPSLVNPSDTNREFDPQIAVGARGVVAVTYYSMVNRTNGGKPLPTRYLFQASTDRGVRFARAKVLGGPFDMRRIPSVGGYFVGDYEGLTAYRNGFVSLFVLPTGSASSKTTEIVAARVRQ